MEITKPEDVNEALLSKSQTRTLDELRRRGKEQVKVIRATDVTEMIKESVNRVLRDTKLLSDEDIELLVQSGTKEFKRVFRERQLERQRIEQKFRDVQDELFTAQKRVRELEQQLAGSGERRQAPGGMDADLLMRMMNEMAQLKASMAQQGGAAGGASAAAGGGAATDSVAQALSQISAALNDRLDKFGRKMGISTAVEGKEIKYDTLFKDDDDSGIESNMGDVEVKQNTGGGIAGNLARLKKLKGNG